MGGEKKVVVLAYLAGQGSPPRGRGKVLLLNVGDCVTGITPAWAGKRERESVLFNVYEDHPRVGGEKGQTFDGSQIITGSPPRGRGKDGALGHILLDGGITPAWAGKSQGAQADVLGIRDHPRVGGEKTRRATISCWARGSPPRGRGKGFRIFVPGLISRITPAWAGKRCRVLFGVQGFGDHPRVGGEKTKKIP